MEIVCLNKIKPRSLIDVSLPPKAAWNDCCASLLPLWCVDNNLAVIHGDCQALFKIEIKMKSGKCSVKCCYNFSVSGYAK
jgi:hypothetical protein